MIEVVAEPESPFPAVNVTTYGVARAVPIAGVQVRTPEALPAPGVNAAFEPAGSPERLAVSEAMAWPSGSDAVTATVTALFSRTVLVAVAVTTGARSVLATVIAALLAPVSPLAAEKVAV